MDLRRPRSDVLRFTAPVWLTAPTLVWLFGHVPPMRVVMEWHADPEERRAVCRDTLAEARRLAVSVPRLEAAAPYFAVDRLVEAQGRGGVPVMAEVRMVTRVPEESDCAFVGMDDGVRLATWTTGLAANHTPALVMVHGGPGLPDYLSPVAAIVADLFRVHRYDQRGTGGSTWEGEHTIARHVRDLELLIDAWGHDRVVLVGHSFGTDLVSFFLLAHPGRVAGIVYLAGPFLGAWREPAHATEASRRSPHQRARLEALGGASFRTDAEEIEFLTLSWFPDHADPRRAWAWAEDAAQNRRPVNYAMNAQLNTDKRRVPLESRVGRLRALRPPTTAIVGGEGDPRPASFLRELAHRLDCEVTIIPDAGHEPWLEQPTAFRTALRSALGPHVGAGSAS